MLYNYIIYFILYISSISQYSDAVQDLSRVWLAPGFQIEQYMSSIMNVRSITQSKYNPWITYYGSLVNQVYVIVDDGSGIQANRHLKVAITGFAFWPQFDPIGSVGVVWYKGSLYCAEDHQVYRFDNIDSKIDQFPIPKSQADFISPYFEHWTATTQPGFLHNWKTALAIANERLYLVIGAPCNNCLQPDYGKIISIDLATLSQERTEAEGVRSCVGMDFSPKTGELWFADNGRDAWTLPNDFTAQYRRPSDEINRITGPGLHFGFPYCYGSGKTFESGGNDPEFFTGDCTKSQYTNSLWDLQPHTAPLGIQFLQPNNWPQEFQGSIVYAGHGCYICVEKSSGYIVSSIQLDSTGTIPIAEHQIAIFRHFPADQTYEGRPVDIQNMPDGSILVSDDTYHQIYRITYNAAPATATPTTAAPTTATPTTATPTTAAPTTATPTTAAPTTATPTTATPTTATPTTPAPSTPSPTPDPKDPPNNGYYSTQGASTKNSYLGLMSTVPSTKKYHITQSKYQRKK